MNNGVSYVLRGFLAGYTDLAEKEGFWMELKVERIHEKIAINSVEHVQDEWRKTIEESGGLLPLEQRYVFECQSVSEN